MALLIVMIVIKKQMDVGGVLIITIKLAQDGHQKTAQSHRPTNGMAARKPK
jgi:hypothetical protein